MALTNPYVPAAQIPMNWGDLYIHYNCYGRTRQNRRARLRPTLRPAPYPEGRCLGLAVLAQAGKDAKPELTRGGTSKLMGVPCRMRQCESLIWLCGTDPDLLFWCRLAEYRVSHLHHEFKPLLLHFIAEFPEIAAKFSLPEWTRAH